MDILLKRAECEIVVKKSRFISIALPCTSLEDIKPLVKSIRDEHPDSTHVVHAAVIGPKGDLYSMSDDREPKNTAGRPALEVLKGSGVTNILVFPMRNVDNPFFIILRPTFASIAAVGSSKI